MPEKEYIVNGTFDQTVPGTSSNVRGDLGDPAAWTSNEPVSEDQVETVSGAIHFSRNNSAVGASISQQVTGLKSDGRDTTFSFNYLESGPGTVDVKVRYDIVAPNGNVVRTGTITTNGQNVSITFQSNFTSYTVRITDTSVGTTSRDAVIDNVSLKQQVVCFVAGTMIATPRGERAVEALSIGDQVTTRDGHMRPIRWIGRSRVFFSDGNLDKLRPVRIAAGALGNGFPEADLFVSRQHRVLLQSKIAMRMFGTDEVLTAAKNLIGLVDGVDVVEDTASVEYLHVLLDRHELLLANGAWAESLYLGDQTLTALTEEQRKEISMIFPELTRNDTDASQIFARQVLKKGETRNLVKRSQQNGRPLVEA